jgi:MEDS: MEthanogen/methylotroph, DcmR Sensory domain
LLRLERHQEEDCTRCGRARILRNQLRVCILGRNEARASKKCHSLFDCEYVCVDARSTRARPRSASQLPVGSLSSIRARHTLGAREISATRHRHLCMREDSCMRKDHLRKGDRRPSKRAKSRSGAGQGFRPALRALGSGHVCALYSTHQEYSMLLRTFLEIEIARGEKCICAVSSASRQSTGSSMRAGSAYIHDAMERGDIELTTLERVPGGRSISHRSGAQLLAESRRAGRR